MDEPTPTEIKEWLKRLGKDRAWLAQKTGQSEATVNNWLAKNKPRAINPHAARKIRELMDAPIFLNPLMPISLYAAAQADAERQGITMDEWTAQAFAAKIAKAATLILLFVGGLCALGHMADGQDATAAAMLGAVDALGFAAKALYFVACAGIEIVRACC